MNKNITPSGASCMASAWFINYLQRKLGESGDTYGKLAKAVGLERKAILAYVLGYRSPKLEVVAKIMEYYGETSITIPIRNNKGWIKRNDDRFDWLECSVCGYGSDGEVTRATPFCPICGADMRGGAS